MRYLTEELPGTGGRIKVHPADFGITEIPRGSRLGNAPTVVRLRLRPGSLASGSNDPQTSNQTNRMPERGKKRIFLMQNTLQGRIK